jgi:hypothetical protein
MQCPWRVFEPAYFLGLTFHLPPPPGIHLVTAHWCDCTSTSRSFATWLHRHRSVWAVMGLPKSWLQTIVTLLDRLKGIPLLFVIVRSLTAGGPCAGKTIFWSQLRHAVAYALASGLRRSCHGSHHAQSRCRRGRKYAESCCARNSCMRKVAVRNEPNCRPNQKLFF